MCRSSNTSLLQGLPRASLPTAALSARGGLAYHFGNVICVARTIACIGAVGELSGQSFAKRVSGKARDEV